MAAIAPGLVGEASLIVGETHTVKHLGSGGVEVLATPVMIALMEDAARSSVDSKLDQGQLSVGVNLNISHLAATPVWMRVTARSELVAVDSRSDCRKSQWLRGGSPWIRWAIESGCFLGGWSLLLFSLEAYFFINDHLQTVHAIF